MARGPMSEQTKQKIRDKMKGREPWHKGTKGLMKPNKGSFKKGHVGVDCGEKIKEAIKKRGGAWNKGISPSDETKIKISNTLKGNIPWNSGTKGKIKANSGSFKKGMKSLRGMLGKKHKEESNIKRSLSIGGEKHYNWKGGISSINLKIRHSREYKKWRESVFKRDDYTCVFCKKRGSKINADHIKPFALYPELRLDINNGRTLCEPCHKKTPTYGNRKQKN